MGRTHRKKINLKCTFCGFSFTPMSKCRKRPWNLYKYRNSFFLKNELFFDHRVRNVPKCLQKPRCLGWFKTSQAKRSIRPVENKVEFLERQFHSEKLSFVHKKETEHSFELSLSICVFYRRIFNLEMQNFSLENHHIMIAPQARICLVCWTNCISDTSVTKRFPHKISISGSKK